MGEVKNIRDQGHAALKWAKSRREIGLEARNDASEIVLLAERRLGAMLKGMEKNRGAQCQMKGRDSSGSPMMLPPEDETPTLSDVGITRSQSSRWQSAAAYPDPAFNQWVTSMREAGKELTSGALLKLGKQHQKQRAKPVRRKPKQDKEAPVTDTLDELIQTDQTFVCIYADPPWQYGNQATRAATDNHYQTMTVEAICEEPVANLVAENAHLHLWTTNAFLPDAFKVLSAWGFEYKSVFVWVKPQMGIGNYWRVSHEFMLLGVRGQAPFEDKGLRSWFEAKRTKHSRKPWQVREMIQKASPGPYLEMYGREPIKGWTVYGDQIEEKLFA